MGITKAHTLLVGLFMTLAATWRSDRDERGDVPGWVMITVMSAGIVAGLAAIAGPELEQMLRNALNSVN